jgi:hypothetical protein
VKADIVFFVLFTVSSCTTVGLVLEIRRRIVRPDIIAKGSYCLQFRVTMNRVQITRRVRSAHEGRAGVEFGILRTGM